MRSRRQIEGELKALRSDLLEAARSAARPVEAAVRKAEESAAFREAKERIEALADDLDGLAEEAGREAEAALARHPLLVLGSAFLIGLLIGRLSSRP